MFLGRVQNWHRNHPTHPPEKGKKAKLVLTGVFHDQWWFDKSDDGDTHDWYLYAREATSVTFTVNGKLVEMSSGD